MPCKTISDLPDNIKKTLPADAQKVFLAVVNEQLEKKIDEERALKIAWTAVENAGFEKNKKTGNWEKIEKATWTTAYINDLPDDAFLYVEPGGEKDDDNKTVPRALRHFPYKSANGEIDLPHLRNALARIPQSKLPASIREKCTSKAQEIFEEIRKNDDAVFPEGEIAIAKEAYGITLSDAISNARHDKTRWLLWESPSLPNGVALYDIDKTNFLAKSLSGSYVPAWLPRMPQVAFLTCSPTALEAARRQMLVGPDGELFCENYLKPLNLCKENVAILSACPIFLTTPKGEQRAPTSDEIREWMPVLAKELAALQNIPVIALGSAAASVIGNIAIARLPHPGAIRKHHDSGELGRKLNFLKNVLTNWKPCAQQYANVDDSWTVLIQKADVAKRLVEGVVLEPNTPDAQRDVVACEEIEKAAHEYLATSRAVAYRHRAPLKATVVESWIAKSDFKWGDDPKPVKAGSWCMAVKIHDDATWTQVEKGEINAFSIGGIGKRTILASR